MSDKDRAWEEVQKKAFTHWVNNILSKRDLQIEEIDVQLGDGITIVHFVELLVEAPLKTKYTKTPKQKIHKIENTHLSLEFLKENGVQPRYLTVSSEDFVDGNLKMILGFLWMLFRKFNIAKQMGVEDVDKTTEGLLNWCKEITEGYRDVDITDFKHSFCDGNSFLAMVHAFDTDAFSYDDELDSLSTKEKLAKSFDRAEKNLGIPQLLDIDELVDGTIDERSVILYISLYFHAFVSNEERNKIENEKKAASAKAVDLENELEILHKKIQNKDEEYSELNSKYEELEKEASTIRSEKEKIEDDIEELRNKFKKLTEEVDQRSQEELKSLGSLKDQLIEHVKKMNGWKDTLGQQREYESETVQIRVEQEISSRQFEDQLEHLSQALGSENKKLDALLKQREIEEQAAAEEEKRKGSKAEGSISDSTENSSEEKKEKRRKKKK